MITIQHMTKYYRKKHVYEDVSLEIRPQAITVIVGQNGIGKSTLLKIMAGIEKVNNGTVLYEGERWSKKERQQRIGYVPQEIALWEQMTVLENIRFFKGLLKKPIDDKKIQHYLKALALNDYEKTPIRKLSGGTQRKVNLLIGLLAAPSILILDEPTVGIDLKSRTEIQRLLIALKQHTTIVLTTHLMDEITALSDYTILVGDDPFYEKFLSDLQIVFSSI